MPVPMQRRTASTAESRAAPIAQSRAFGCRRPAIAFIVLPPGGAPSQWRQRRRARQVRAAGSVEGMRPNEPGGTVTTGQAGLRRALPACYPERYETR
jgi:hypothetical protein